MSSSLKKQDSFERVNLIKKNLEMTNKLSGIIAEKNKIVRVEMFLEKRNKVLIQENELLKKEIEILKQQKKSLKKQVEEYQAQIINSNNIKTDLIKCKSDLEAILRQFKPTIIKSLTPV